MLLEIYTRKAMPMPRRSRVVTVIMAAFFIKVNFFNATHPLYGKQTGNAFILFIFMGCGKMRKNSNIHGKVTISGRT